MAATPTARKFSRRPKHAQIAEAVVYPILVMPITNDARTQHRRGERADRRSRTDTGGRVFAAHQWTRQLDDAFSGDFDAICGSQYLLGYYPSEPPDHEDRFPSVRVEVSRPGFEGIHTQRLLWRLGQQTANPVDCTDLHGRQKAAKKSARTDARGGEISQATLIEQKLRCACA